MFCPNCEASAPDNAAFCGNCGKKLPITESNGDTPGSTAGSRPTSSTPSMSAQASPSSYHELGGWLALLAYGMLVGVALIVIGAVIGGFALIQYAQYLGTGLLLLGLAEIALYIPVVYCCVKMFRMIKNRDCMFLRFYEMTMLTLGGVNVVLIIIGAVSGYLSPSEHFKSLLEATIIFVVWLTYLSKSVRVRTYFGTDAYLKNSILLKNKQAPDSVDQ